MSYRKACSTLFASIGFSLIMFSILLGDPSLAYAAKTCKGGCSFSNGLCRVVDCNCKCSGDRDTCPKGCKE
jgi:hypothetical protein